MPELPEVEATARGIGPHLVGQSIAKIQARTAQLRWPVPNILIRKSKNQKILGVSRRAKYILIDLEEGAIIVHLGMSGSLRITTADALHRKHDHIDLYLNNGVILRYHDPRRFGCWLWQDQSPHPLLEKLGWEPLTDAFNAKALWQKAQGRQTSVKNFLMDQRIVVGVGNIYAAEALFLAKIDPSTPAQLISKKAISKLVDAVKKTLAHAIDRGGTTLKDFLNPDGNPGYFEQELWVYGRKDQPCKKCGAIILNRTIGQRSSFYCPRCQR